MYLNAGIIDIVQFYKQINFLRKENYYIYLDLALNKIRLI